MKNRRFGLMIMLLAGALAAQATQYWWAGDGVNLGGSGLWNTVSNNWRSGSEAGAFTAWPNGGSDEAVFTNEVGGAAGTVTLSGTINVNALSFKTNAWTVTGGTLNLGSGTSTITMANVSANSHQTIHSGLAGSGTLTAAGKASYGYGLCLTANNSAFTGKIIADKASDYFGVAVTNDNALGAAPATYTPDAITLRNGAFLVHDGAGTLALATNRGILVQNDNSMIFNRNSGTILLSCPITGGGKFLLRKGVLVIDSTNNAYKGQLHVYGDGDSVTVRAGAENVISHGNGVANFFLTHWNGGSAVFDLNGYSQILPGLTWAGNGAATTRVVDNLMAGKSVTSAIGDNNLSQTFDGCIRNTAGTLSLTKVGTGTQTLTGTNAFSGATAICGGTLLADLGKSNSVDIRTNVLPSASALVLGGGTLSVKGATTGASLQTMGNLSITGYAALSITPNGGTGTTLALGNTWTRPVGGTLLADISAAGSTLKSAPTLTNGVIGGYAFVKDGTGTGFATVSGGNVVRYTGATTLDATVAAANLDGTVNYTVPASVQLTGPAATQTVSTLQIGGATAPLRVSDGMTLVVGAGGILFVNTGWSTIAYFGSGRVTSSMGDLVVNTSGGEAGFFINLVDNGSRKVGLTKTGANNLYLSDAQVYSGDTVINQGQLRRPVYLPSGSGKGDVLVNWNGTLELADTANAIPIKINGLSQVANNPGGVVQNSYNGPRTLMVGHGDANGSFAGTIIDSGTNTLAFVKVGAGTQILSGVNTYAGGTTLSNGVLAVSSLGNIGGANAAVTFAGGTLRITGTTFTSFGATPLTFTSLGGGLDISDAGNSFTLTNDLASGTVLSKTGSGSLTLTGTQAGTIITDDSSKIGFGAGLGFYNLGVTSGGVLSPAGSGTVGALAVNNDLTLSGKQIGRAHV